MCTLNPIQFQILPILASFIFAMLLGSVWFGPLFGKAWMAEVGYTKEDIDKKDCKPVMFLMLLLSIISLFALAAILSFTAAKTVPDALIVAVVIGLGICATGAATNAVYENRSLKYIAITQGYNILNLSVAAIIITLWK